MFASFKHVARFCRVLVLLLLLSACSYPFEQVPGMILDMAPPEGAWIDAPLNGAEAPPGIPIKVIGHVDPLVGQGILYINGTNAGLPSMPIPGKQPPAYEWQWTPEQPGLYYLRVGGAEGPLSSPVEVIISGQMTFKAEFWADQTSLRTGECTSLHWKTENAALVLLDGTEVEQVGDQGVCITQNEEHQLHVEYKDKTEEDLSVQLFLIVDTPTPTPTIYIPPVINTTAAPPPVIKTTAPPPPPKDTQPPPAPSSLSPCGSANSPQMLTSCSVVTLSWNAVKDKSGIAKYRITLVDAYTSKSTQYTTTSTSFNLNNVDSKYRWSVKAQDGAGNWGPSSQTCHFLCVIVK